MQIFRWLKRLALPGLALLLVAVVGSAAAYVYFERDLPSVEELRNYKPPQVTKAFCVDGTRCAEFYRERRTWVQIETLPAHVKNAFLAAEDADFYQHQGLDFLGIARAALRSLLPGNRITGASTISQQACRNLLLSQERTLSRKIREWILTPRMEKALTKDQILNLYMNFVYFGHGRYGIEEAAVFYFGKHAKELTLGEAAVLAGTVQSPHRINPVSNIVRTKARQRYVLAQLAEHGFAPRSATDAEMEKPIVLGPRPPPSVGAYYAEEVRKTLVARYGEQAVLEGGMTVEIAMHPKLQALAEKAVRAGLEAVDRRQGYRGPLGSLDPLRFATLRPLISQRIEETGKRTPQESFIADLTPLSAPQPAEPVGTEEERSDDGEAPPSLDEQLAGRVSLAPASEGLRVAGWVEQVDDAKKFAAVDLVGRKATVSFASVSWARPRKDGRVGVAPTKMSQVMRPGELVLLRITQVTPAPAPLEATLDQLPAVQGALLAINPATRHVAAMVGGYDFERSAFNRATQAKRQPGSSFKPFLYGAALASKTYTSLTVVNDAPFMVRDPWTGKSWAPKNYDGFFEGPMSLRTALTKSKNTVSVRLIEALTPDPVIDLARRAGVTSTLPQNLTLALGTGEVTLLEMANAYATLEALGRYAEPIQILKVMDAKGTVLEERTAAFEEVVDPAVAYLVTSLMVSVVEDGTAARVKELNRPAAGKTGTAQEYRDAWFTGYTADLVASAWVGFDNHDPLGPGEAGGRAALPIWLSFMAGAHDELPARDFEPPPGVTFARIDPATGLLAGNAVPGRLEPFLEGTAPTTEAPPPNQVQPGDFFLHDGRRGGF
ncbi:MAG: penicillin-binding protein 1A [Myxococcota bacterium]